MIYTVYSTTDNPYMQWQSELLEYSWKQVGQKGELIRLVATNRPDRLPTHRHTRVVATQPWTINPNTGDDFAPYNKPASLLEWLYRERPDGTVLFVDPDCVFRAPVTREVEEGHPASQTWIDLSAIDAKGPFGLDDRFAFLARHSVNTQPRVQPVMIPTLIHTADLRRIAGRWLELCGLVRQKARHRNGQPMWESDMIGYIVAAAEYGLVHDCGNYGICTNWPTEAVPDAPIIHYCQAIESHDGTELWDKRSYRPWSKVAEQSLAKQDYGRDLLTIINSYIESRKQAVLDGTVRPRRCEDVQEGRVRDELVLIHPKDQGQAFHLNTSGRAIWELSDGSRSVAEITEELQRRYDCADGTLDADVTTTIVKLHELGVLEIKGG